MAWEEFERNGIKGISGDKPIDEFALALKRIVSSYEDRYSRKPTVVELLYALETVITSNPTRYVSDSKDLKLGEIIVNRNEEFLDTTQYEGVYTEQTIPGYHAILRQAPEQAMLEVIKIPTLEVRERTLVCAYKILVDDITDKMVETLILSVLLQDYCDRYYEDQADQIDLLNLKSNVRSTIPYSSET
ncbi:hypothetical protein PN36_34360 [Candidatus Thiomargarita nelsonii]|uniref:Uncharacterized protein n=1 Tax=Candidatus Thiomargarita nelsonii TaxID=1003181 RepID=A0A0A6RND6_9GAMM|nr:hypothetical protein PN36_34360 [Candidatus Thiomargarita nelsonii]